MVVLYLSVFGFITFFLGSLYTFIFLTYFQLVLRFSHVQPSTMIFILTSINLRFFFLILLTCSYFLFSCFYSLNHSSTKKQINTRNYYVFHLLIPHLNLHTMTTKKFDIKIPLWVHNSWRQKCCARCDCWCPNCRQYGQPQVTRGFTVHLQYLWRNIFFS